MTKSCLYCQQKLALLEAVTGELFCSPEHRELYFEAEVAIAFELLTSVDKPASAAPVAKPGRPTRSWVAPGIAACLAIFVLGAIFFGASQKSEHSFLPSATAPLAAAEQITSPAQATSQPAPLLAATTALPMHAVAQTPKMPVAPTAPFPTPPRAASAPVRTIAASEADIHHTASIAVKETSWVAVCSDGTEILGAMLSPGDVRKIEFSSRAVVRTGNAGGIAVAVDGKSIGPMGPPSGLRVVELNPEATPRGFRLLSLKPGVNGACVAN